MSWQYDRWTMQQARILGYSVWDLYYTRWGWSNPDSSDIGKFFPNPDETARLDSVAAIVIGSRSTWDRVFVRYTVPTNIVEAGLVSIWSDGFRILDFYTARVFSPLKVPVTGPVVIHAAEQASYAPGFETTYYPAGSGAATTIPGLDNGRFEFPGLHLQFLLKNVPGGVIPTIRDPLYRRDTETGVDAGAETFWRGIPVMGRKRARFNINVESGTVTFRLAGLTPRGVAGSVPPDSSVPFIETTLATIAGVTTTSTGYFDYGLAYDYLMLYYTVSAGPATFTFNAIIEDDGCCIGGASGGGGS